MAGMVFALVMVLSLSCLGQVRMEATLGWGGVPVLERVNPLWVTVVNPGAGPLAGTLTVEAEIGSPWRGVARRALRVPVLLPPGGRGAFTFPWPLRRGTRELRLRLTTPAGTVGDAVLPISPAMEPLSGTVGGEGPGYPLAPGDITDPLLLHPFGELRVEAPLGPDQEAALLAWAVYLGGRLTGLPAPAAWPWPEPDGLSRAFVRLPLPRPPLAPLAISVAAYLLGIGFFLPPAARGRPRPALIATGVSLCLALFSQVFYKPLSGSISCIYEFSDSTASGFYLEFSCLTGTGAEWEGEGWWVELLPLTEAGWAGRDLRWEWGEGGVRTVVPVRPGEIRILWRLAPGGPAAGETYRWEGELVRVRDGRRGDYTSLISPALEPLWEAIYPQLFPGEELTAAVVQSRPAGGVEWRLSLEVRRGG